MTQTPGTPAYMPPEVMVAKPSYNTSVDVFSCGILMIHVLSGQWPEPQIGPNRFENDILIPVTEAERRETFLRAIGDESPVMDLILRCVKNGPSHRPHASEILERLVAMTLQFPSSFANKLDILQYIERQKEEKKTSEEEKGAEIDRNRQHISSLRKEVLEKAEEIVRLNLVHSSEVGELKLQVRDSESQNQLLLAQGGADVKELKAKVEIYEAQIKSSDLSSKEERKEFEMQLAKERESCKKLAIENQELQSKVSNSWTNSNALSHKISTLEADVLTKDATIEKKDSELCSMTKVIEDKESVVLAMKQQLSRAREYLSTKQQGLRARIAWKQCADVPNHLRTGKATVLNGKVYFGGGVTEVTYDADIFCYDPSHDHWTTLPRLPVIWYGLGQVNGQLVAVGGRKKSDHKQTKEVYTYIEQSRRWKQTVPPMCTARDGCGVLSLQSALVVAGGETPLGTYTNTVEIFKVNTSQWCKTSPTPRACRDMALVNLGNTCFALGGYERAHLNFVFSASIHDILHGAVPTDETPSSDAWETLEPTPRYRPAGAVLAGRLVALGGMERMESPGGSAEKEIYMYSHSSDSWIYIGDLPAPRAVVTAVVLSTTEILVMGGFCGHIVNTVYKGTIQLEM